MKIGLLLDVMRVEEYASLTLWGYVYDVERKQYA